jgi:hypothetical protein
MKTFDHAVRGTCNDESCSLHGVCHCGCGRATTIVDHSNRGKAQIGGMPSIFHAGHHPRRPRTRDAKVRAAQAAVKARDAKRIPSEKVQPLAVWLHERYGSARIAAEVAGLRLNTFCNVRYKCVSRSRKNVSGTTLVTPATARKLIDAVLAHRIPDGSRSPYDVERRFPTPREREETRRDYQARERRRYREKAKGAVA